MIRDFAGVDHRFRLEAFDYIIITSRSRAVVSFRIDCSSTPMQWGVYGGVR